MIGLSDRLGQGLPQTLPSKREAVTAWWTEVGCLALIFGVAAVEIALLCVVFN